jgi:hypothetical protein
MLSRLQRTRLAMEYANLDPEFERSLAEERMSEDLRQGPEY